VAVEELSPNLITQLRWGGFVPIPKKKSWVKPTVRQFSSYEEARAYYLSRAKPEDIAALDRMFEEFRGVKQMYEAELVNRRLHRSA